MPEPIIQPTEEESSDENKTAEKAGTSNEGEQLSEEELEAEAEAELEAEAEELQELRDNNAKLSKESQQNQSQVDKVRQGAEDKKAQLEASLEETEDPSEKLNIEKAIFELERGLFELSKEVAADSDLTSEIVSTLEELGYAEDSDIAKKLLAIASEGEDGASDIIETQLDLLRTAGVRVAEKKEEKKLPADIDANRQKTETLTKGTPSVKPSDFTGTGEKRDEAVANMQNFLETLGKKGL